MKEFIKWTLAIINAIALIWAVGATVAMLPWSIRLPVIIFFVTYVAYYIAAVE